VCLQLIICFSLEHLSASFCSISNSVVKQHHICGKIEAKWPHLMPPRTDFDRAVAGVLGAIGTVLVLLALLAYYVFFPVLQWVVFTLPQAAYHAVSLDGAAVVALVTMLGALLLRQGRGKGGPLRDWGARAVLLLSALLLWMFLIRSLMSPAEPLDRDDGGANDDAHDTDTDTAYASPRVFGAALLVCATGADAVAKHAATRATPDALRSKPFAAAAARLACALLLLAYTGLHRGEGGGVTGDEERDGGGSDGTVASATSSPLPCLPGDDPLLLQSSFFWFPFFLLVLLCLGAFQAVELYWQFLLEKKLRMWAGDAAAEKLAATPSRRTLEHLNLSHLDAAGVPVDALRHVGGQVARTLSLASVTRLDLSSNRIAALPADFFSLLPTLTRIDLSSNRLKRLPRLLDAAALQQLRLLDLSDNALEALPPGLRLLPRLGTLRLAGNNLGGQNARVVDHGRDGERVGFPGIELGESASLQELSLERNPGSSRIEIELPAGLRRLSFGNDRGASLTANISQLRHLSELSIVCGSGGKDRANGTNAVVEVSCSSSFFCALPANCAVKLEHATLLEDGRPLVQKDAFEAGEIALTAWKNFINEYDLAEMLMETVTPSRGLLLDIFASSRAPSHRQINSKLHSVNLSKRGLRTVPGAIALLKDLSRLDVSQNSLSELPWSLSLLQSLLEVHCSDNRLSNVPPGLLGSSNLITLNLAGNSIAMLPQATWGPLDDDSQPCSLQWLSCARNPLTSLPASISKLQALKELYLDSCSLQALPAEICGLKYLECISCNDNRLRVLPECIGNLSCLRDLRVAGNELSALPLSVGSLPTLHELDVSRNPLARLPSSIGDLKTLAECRMADLSAMVELPSEFLQLQDDCIVYLRSSTATVAKSPGRNPAEEQPMLTIPLETATVQQVREFVSTFTGDQMVDPQYVRLMLVGNGGAGKTTLSEALCGRTFGQTMKQYVRGVEHRKVTFGLDVSEWKVKKGDMKALSHHGRALRFAIWDFAGQPEYHPTHQLFLNSDALYVLVFHGADAVRENTTGKMVDKDRTFGLKAAIEYLETWISLIGSRAAGARILLVATHADSGVFKHKSGERNKRRLLETMEAFIARVSAGSAVHIVGARCYLIDAWNADAGYKELYAAAIRSGAHIVATRGKIPKKLSKLRRDIKSAAAKTPIMTRNDFLQLVSRKSGVRVNNITQILRHWGWIEHFERVPQLSDSVFLDPQWIAKQLACVVTHMSTGGGENRSDGLVTRTDLNSAWAARGSEKWTAKLVEVMLAFELAFPFSDCEFVMPSTLPPGSDPAVESRLAAFDGFQKLLSSRSSGEQCRHSFSFSVFPSGLFGRLFVRILSVSEPTIGWRTGFVACPESPANVLRARLRRNKINVEACNQRGIDIFTEALLSLLDEIYTDMQLFRDGALVSFAPDDHGRASRGDSAAIASEKSAAATWLRRRPVVELTPALLEFDSETDVELRNEALLGQGAFGEVLKVYATGDVTDFVAMFPRRWFADFFFVPPRNSSGTAQGQGICDEEARPFCPPRQRILQGV
jgi:Leucine-rich repeat (LRR) protein/GTPase SAR1 family protein